jgi:hypothetical protein
MIEIDGANFTEQQATTLVGRYVRARLHWGGVPGGALGVVTGTRESPPGWGLVIEWDLPAPIKKQTNLLTFARGDFERALEDVTR